MNSGRIPFINVVCYKWGSLYSPIYVNRLYAMIERNLSIPHVFHCITDSPFGLNKNIIVHPLLDDPKIGNGCKLRTFSNDFLGLDGQYVLSVDLDVLIVDTIDFVGEKPELDFVIAEEWDGKTRGHGAFYRLKIGSMPEIWSEFNKNIQNAINPNKPGKISEQYWLDRKIQIINHFPRGKIVSFKAHCNARGLRIFGKWGERMGLTTSHWGQAKIPHLAAVISFHGNPNMHEVADKNFRRWRKAPFIKDYWIE